MKEQIKVPENRTKRWRDSQTIRCRVQNTGNQDAYKNGGVWSQNRGKSEGYEKWNKGKCTGTNSDRKETGTQRCEFNGVDQKEERNIQSEKNEEIIQKNERLRNLQDIFKHSNIQIIGVPEGEEENKKLETYLKT